MGSMNIRSVLYIEDNAAKYMGIARFLKSIGIGEIKWVGNAQKGVEEAERAHLAGNDYDLLILDMHFDFFGTDDVAAGEKTMKLLREKGICTPIIFCSSQNWKIPGAEGNIFFNDRRDWEQEAEELIKGISERMGR